MKQPRFLLWLILILTVFSFYIDFSFIPFSYTTSKLPIINKKITIRPFWGDNIQFSFWKFSFLRDISFRKGLDLAGGTSVTLKADMSKVPKNSRDSALQGATDVISRRVNLFGVREPIVRSVSSVNDYRIIVELPGITDTQEAVSLVGTTASLEFREVEQATSSAQARLRTFPTGLSGADVKSAEVTFNSQNGEPVVSFTVADKSQKKFFEATTKLIGKQMAIFLDNQFISSPTVQGAIRDSGQITGNFTTDQAKRLAAQLNAGALPVSLTVLSQNTIGATLGQVSLNKSLFAGILGFITIVIFMCVLYGRLGILACFALILYTIFTLALFKLIPITLTLAGIAGFILSIGMAVDANILIFERMKEEQRKGKSTALALEQGFSRAWSSIRDSNISTIITAIILFHFGTGTVRGFAVTLFLGVIVSMFSAITVTRTFLRIFYKENPKSKL